MNKEERRRMEVRRKQLRIRRTKAALVATVAVVMPLLFFLAMQR